MVIIYAKSCHRMLKVFALFSVLLCTSLSQDVGFAGSSQLSPSPLYNLTWNVTGNRINFVVIVETTGWVGFGISPNGLMLDSDVIMGCVDDNTAVVTLTVSGLNHSATVSNAHRLLVV